MHLKQCNAKNKQLIMGCINTQNSSERHPQHPHVAKYIQIMRLDHPLNVNKKYDHICKIVPSMHTGSGLRKSLIETCAYECLTTEPDFNAKRKQFWETRTSGSKQLWTVIQKCLRMDSDDDINSQLDHYGLTCLNGSIQMCVDYNFTKYDVPIFCINRPLKFADLLPAEKNLKIEFEQQVLEVKIRSTKFPKDVVLSVPNTLSVEDIKDQYLSVCSLDAAEFKVRLFYNGAELLHGYQLGSFSLRPGHVIQAMINKIQV